MLLKNAVIQSIPINMISLKADLKKAWSGCFGYKAFLKYYPLNEEKPVRKTYA